MKWRIVVPVVPVFLTVAVVAGIVNIVRQPKYPMFDDESPELDSIVEKIVESSVQIHNCVLAVMKGDGSFAWSGAAGIADADGSVPMTGDTPIHIASITKLFTATAVMQLQEQDALAIDDPMADYLPDELIRGVHVYQGRDYSDEITIEQLLAQTSGIADYYDDKPEGGESCYEMFLKDPERIWTVEETIVRARDDLEPHFPPGTAAYYSDTNYQLLGKIIEAVTGKSLERVYEEFFFRPLGMQHSWLAGYSEPQATPSAATADVFAGNADITKIRSNGSYWADGGIITTVKEAVFFLQALNEGRMIGTDTVERMHDWRPMNNLPFQYGYGTMYLDFSFINLGTDPPPLWGHSGSPGSFLYYSEDLDLYMAGTINQTENLIVPLRLMMQVLEVMG